MRVKLRNLYVDGFKNITDSSIPIHDLTTIVGPNNSGKSNLLEIFSLITNLFFGSDEGRKLLFEEGRTRRGGSVACHLESCEYKPVTIKIQSEVTFDDNVTLEVQYDLIFKCKDIYADKQNISVDNIGFVYEELKIKEKHKSGRPKCLLKRENNILEARKPDGKFFINAINNDIPAYKALEVLYPDKAKLDPYLEIGVETLIASALVSVFLISPHQIRKNIGRDSNTSIWHEYEVNYFNILNEIYTLKQNKDIFSEFTSALQEILGFEDIRFDTIEFPPDPSDDPKSPQTKFHNFKLKLPGQPYANIKEFSDGTLTVIAILIGLLSPDREDVILCIEEPENCLHPRALKTLINYLNYKKDEYQIIITTHSQTVVNLVDPRCIIFANVQSNGTYFRAIDNIDDLNRRLRNSNFDFGSLLETDFKIPEAEQF